MFWTFGHIVNVELNHILMFSNIQTHCFFLLLCLSRYNESIILISHEVLFIEITMFEFQHGFVWCFFGYSLSILRLLFVL